MFAVFTVNLVSFMSVVLQMSRHKAHMQHCVTHSPNIKMFQTVAHEDIAKYYTHVDTELLQDFW